MAEEQEKQAPNINMPIDNRTQNIDGTHLFNRFIVEPRSQEDYPHLNRDIKLSKFDRSKQTMAMEISRRIERLHQIGNFLEPVYEEDYVTDKKTGETFVRRTHKLSPNGQQLFELKNKFQRSLAIYKHDLAALCQISSAEGGFERQMLVSQLTQAKQHYVEETPEQQRKGFLNFFGRGKRNG